MDQDRDGREKSRSGVTARVHWLDKKWNADTLLPSVLTFNNFNRDSKVFPIQFRTELLVSQAY